MAMSETKTWTLQSDTSFEKYCVGYASVGLKLIEMSDVDGNRVLSFDNSEQGGFDRTTLDTDNMPLTLEISSNLESFEVTFQPNEDQDIAGTYKYEVIYHWGDSNDLTYQYTNTDPIFLYLIANAEAESDQYTAFVEQDSGLFNFCDIVKEKFDRTDCGISPMFFRVSSRIHTDPNYTQTEYQAD